MGLPPSEPAEPVVQKPDWMAERHYALLRPLHQSGCTPEKLRAEYARVKSEEREWVRENLSIEQEVQFECLLEAKAANAELDRAFEEIYLEIAMRKDEVATVGDIEEIDEEGVAEEGVEDIAEEDVAEEDVEVVANACAQEELHLLLQETGVEREVASVLVDRQAELTLNPLQRRRIKQFEKSVQRVLDGIDSTLDCVHIEVMVGVANELVTSWLKSSSVLGKR